MELIGSFFGFRSSKDLDKFATCETAFDASGMPYVAEQACARFSARVVQEVDLGTHVLFVGEVEEAERLCAEAPMTYAYYHQVKGGKTPPKASSYLPGEDAPAPTSAARRSRRKRQAAPEKAESASAPQYAWRCRCAAIWCTRTSFPTTSCAPSAAWARRCSSASPSREARLAAGA